MDSIQPPGFDKARTQGHAATDTTRWFYAGAAILLLILVFWGFQQFYLHGRTPKGGEIRQPIRTLIIAHGCAMTLWVILLVAQSLLVTTRKVRLHMSLGKIGVVLAAAVFVLGIKVGIEKARLDPTLEERQFLMVPLTSMVIFAGFVTIGIFQRTRKEVHRPLMLFATLAVMGAPTVRIGFFHQFYDGTLWATIFGPYSVSIAIGILFLTAHSLLIRTFDRRIALLLAVIAVVDAGVMVLRRTPAWDAVANFLLGI